MPQRHLWDYNDHLNDPRGGSDSPIQFATLDDLQRNLTSVLGPLNMPYSWHWHTPDQHHEDDELHIHIAMAFRTVTWVCPITRDQEPAARRLLAQCAQYQQSVWAAATSKD